MTVTIPTSEAQYGYVVGRVIRALGDSADPDDKPDAVAAAGKVTFTPKATLGRTTDYSAFIVREKIDAPLDAQGNLVRYEGATPAGISLTVGAYKVEFALASGSIPSFEIEVTAAHTQAAPLDLVTAAPYVPPSGVTVNTMLVPADAVIGQVLGWSASGLDWVDMVGGGGGGAVSSVAGRTGAVVLSSADLSDSTATGRSLLTADDAAAARTAIGAGTSSLAIGTTGTTAAAGNRQATETAIGMVELATTAEATAGTDTSRAVTPAGVKAVTDTKAPIRTTPTVVTGATYTLAAGDENTGIRTTSATAATVTVPDTLPVGYVAPILVDGAGMVTIVAGSGVTIVSAEAPVSRKTGSTLAVQMVAAGRCWVVGDFA